MPAVSKKQYRAMRAAEHDPKTAKAMGIKPSQAKEIADATKNPKKLPEKAKGKKRG
jgi:endonuclease V-like protein UPF0215 family